MTQSALVLMAAVAYLSASECECGFVQTKQCLQCSDLIGNLFPSSEKHIESISPSKTTWCIQLHCPHTLSPPHTHARMHTHTHTHTHTHIRAGLFTYKRCPKGKHCNFLHVFRNPGGAFSRADQDLSHHSPPPRRRSSYHDWSYR